MLLVSDTNLVYQFVVDKMSQTRDIKSHEAIVKLQTGLIKFNTSEKKSCIKFDMSCMRFFEE